MCKKKQRAAAGDRPAEQVINGNSKHPEGIHMKNSKRHIKMEELVSLCKRRGFIFQTSEIYGGINGFWDYGPLGVELKRNIKEMWWLDMVRHRENVVGLDSSIIMHPRVWEASGHVDGFKDPMVDCRESKSRYRADQVMVFVPRDDDGGSPILSFSEGDEAAAERRLKKMLKNSPDQCDIKPLESMPPDAFPRIIGPDTDQPGTLTEPRSFNLMFKTYIGPLEDSSSQSYLRPETAQGIFTQYANVLSVSRQKVPFGIAQIGKAFRNEINPRNYTFRSREFEQMELEFFIKPGTDAEWHEYWVRERLNWYEKIGLPESQLHRDVHAQEDLAHYASACTDVAYSFPFGVQELEGIAARGNFDLSQHAAYSGKSMEYFDEESGERYVPHVIEPSAGVDRIALAVLCEAYEVEWIKKGGSEVLPAELGAKRPPEGYEARTVLKFAPCLAPIKAAVFPLLKNKPELVDKSREVFEMVQAEWPAFWDQTGAIGRRYRRQDEIGTPFGITIDFDTLEDDTVTVRERDSMRQERMAISEIQGYLKSQIQ